MTERAFIRANTVLTRPPLVPELALYLAAEVVPLWRATEAELELVFQVAERRSALDRAACCEGYEQALRPAGIALGRLSLQVETRQPLFHRCDALVQPALLLRHLRDL